MSTVAEASSSVDAAREPRSQYAWYVVVVLMIAYTLSFIDRQILSLLVQPIKTELGISDTQIGLLQGLAFALFYTLLGLPMGWIVDRFNRRNLIVIGIALWSAMTVLCGAARSFGTLFVARMGVGVGEATLSPAAISIISDYYKKEQLSTALSVYSMGIFIGSGLALLVGGAVIAAVSGLPPVQLPMLGEMSPWRLTFALVGIPGLLVAVLIRTLREPDRTGGLVASDGSLRRLSLRQTVDEIAQRRWSIAGIASGMAFHAIAMYGTMAWLPTFYMRAHNWPVSQTGAVLGLVVLTFGCCGMYVGGRTCDRWQRQGTRHAPLRIGVIAAIVIAVALVTALNAPSAQLSMMFVAPAIFGLALPIGSMFAGLQIILPNQVRGQVSALYLFVISLIGISLGPLLPGALSDSLFADPSRIGDALTMTAGVAAVGMVIAFRACYSPYTDDYRQLHLISTSTT